MIDWNPLLSDAIKIGFPVAAVLIGGWLQLRMKAKELRAAADLKGRELLFRGYQDSLLRHEARALRLQDEMKAVFTTLASSTSPQQSVQSIAVLARSLQPMLVEAHTEIEKELRDLGIVDTYRLRLDRMTRVGTSNTSVIFRGTDINTVLATVNEWISTFADVYSLRQEVCFRQSAALFAHYLDKPKEPSLKRLLTWTKSKMARASLRP